MRFLGHVGFQYLSSGNFFSLWTGDSELSGSNSVTHCEDRQVHGEEKDSNDNSNEYHHQWFDHLC